MIDGTLNVLQPHMFTLKTLSHAHQHKARNNIQLESSDTALIAEWDKTLKKDQNTKEKTSEMFFPKESDQLFWCYYVLVHGFSAYEILDTKRFIVEKTEKLKCVDLIRLHRKQLTANKIRGIDAIETTLVHDRAIDVKTFIALCIVSNLNVLFVHRRKVFEVLFDVEETDNGSNICVIHQYDSPRVRYGYEMDVSPSKMDEYMRRTSTTPETSTEGTGVISTCQSMYYVKAVSITNPLRAISSYKVGELRDMIVALKILDSETAWKKTKPQLYETIMHNL